MSQACSGGPTGGDGRSGGQSARSIAPWTKHDVHADAGAMQSIGRPSLRSRDTLAAIGRRPI